MQFINAIQRSGITPPHNIIADGQIHRFSSNGKPKDESGWYVFHDDGITAGSFGDWRSDFSQSWHADIGRPLTSSEQSAHKARIEAMKAQREAEDISAKADAKERANIIWNAAIDVQPHAYLDKKGVNAYGIKQSGDALVIPLRIDGEIQSLQFINADGSKKFLTGGRIKGCYHSIGKPQDVIYICEGYATGASIREATGSAVVVAFNAGNLKAVAETLRDKFPTIKLVVCADDDASGVGVDKANKAALEVGADVVVPDFGDKRPDGVSDFNDLHQLQGLEAVKLGVAKVARVQVAEPTNGDWVKPSELIQDSESSPYPIDALPSGLGDAVKEVLEFVQCPMALAACSALSALSLAAQHLANVRRAEGLISPVSLYTLAIAESGERKTSVDKHFTSAISTWESIQAELASADVKRYHVEHDSWSMQYDGLKQKIKETSKALKPTDGLTSQLHQLKDSEPPPVRVPRLIYGDSTPEQLGYSLAKCWPSGAVLSSEAGIVFGGSGMTGDSAMRNMALLNVLWEDGTHTIDRRTSESYKVQGARLTMGLAVQSDTVRAFFDNPKQLARGTGFAARFLIAWPDSTQGTRLFKEPPKSFPKLSAFNDRINQLLDKIPMLTDAGGLAPATLDLSPEAKGVWINFHNQVEMELRVGGDMVDARDVASKAADNVARLAALFHLYEWHSEGQINAELVRAATVIVTWHLYEAKRFLHQIATPAHINNAMKLDAYILKYCVDHKTNKVNKNHVRRNGSIRDKRMLDEAISELIEANRIRVVIDDRTSIIEVNPALLGVDYA